MAIRLSLLGGFTATSESGAALDLPTRKSRALLAYLAVPLGALHSRDTLASLLWGGTTDERARNSLRQSLFALRRALGEESGDLLDQQGDSLRLDPRSVEVDVATFERMAGESTRDALGRAAGLFRGELLEGFGLSEPGFDEWVAGERDRLREIAVDAFHRLLTLQAGAGAGQDAIRTAIRLLRLDPLQEPVHRTLMRLYAQRGRRSEALRQFRTCSDLLARDLGVSPEAETIRLHDEILLVGPEPASSPPTLPGHPPAILVVEDDPATRVMLEGSLHAAGYTVVAADDGSDALLKLGRQPFDLIVSDVRMPRVDGFTLLEAMNRDGLTIPVVFVTSGAEPELEAKGLSLGARDYIRKPISKDVLMLRVENALGRRPGRP